MISLIYLHCGRRSLLPTKTRQLSHEREIRDVKKIWDLPISSSPPPKKKLIYYLPKLNAGLELTN